MTSFPKYDRYKDSGVEWLGEVPEHWEVERAFSVFNERVETGHADAELPNLNITIGRGVQVEEFDGARKKRLIEDLNAYKRAKKGDIAYNTMRMWQGAVGDVPVDGLVSPAYVVARPIKPINTRFYSYLFRTETFQTETNRHSYGIRSAANEKWKAEIQALMHYGKGKDDDIESNFLKTWLRAQYGRDTRQRKANAKEEDWERIGGPFHRWVNDQKSLLGLNKEADFVELIQRDIPFFARVYRMILDATHNYTPGLEGIYYNSSNDFTLQTTVLMAAVKRDDSEEVIRRKLQIVATYLDHFLVRRVVNYIRVGYSAVQYTMVQLIKEVRHKTPEELIDILVQRLERDDATLESAKGGWRKGVSDFRLNMFSKRYIHYLLARMTAYVEVSCDKGDRFPAYTNWLPDSKKNPFEVEHLWPYHFEDFETEFQTEDEFNQWRNHLGGLVLLPKSKNASLNDKPYNEKRPHYQDENLLAASLTDLPYSHLPRFKTFREANGYDFKACPAFGKEEQMQRRALYTSLIRHIWSVDRLKEL